LVHFILVFFDDTMVYTKTWEDNIRCLLIITLTMLQNNLLVPNKNKSSCSISRVSYLGHQISATRDHPGLDKIETVQ